MLQHINFTQHYRHANNQIEILFIVIKVINIYLLVI